MDAATQDRAEKDLGTAEMLEKAAAAHREEGDTAVETKDSGDQLWNPNDPKEPQFNHLPKDRSVARSRTSKR